MVLKCALINICYTVMSGKVPSSSGGPLRNVKKKPGRGVLLPSHTKDILTSVISYFDKKSGLGSHS